GVGRGNQQVIAHAEVVGWAFLAPDAEGNAYFDHRVVKDHAAAGAVRADLPVDRLGVGGGELQLETFAADVHQHVADDVVRPAARGLEADAGGTVGQAIVVDANVVEA